MWSGREQRGTGPCEGNLGWYLPITISNLNDVGDPRRSWRPSPQNWAGDSEKSKGSNLVGAELPVDDQGGVQAAIAPSTYTNIQSVKMAAPPLCHPNLIHIFFWTFPTKNNTGKEIMGSNSCITKLTQYKATMGSRVLHEMSWGLVPHFLCCRVHH